MGCASSRILRRSRSFQEELSLSLQRRTNGMPGLEDLLVNKNGGGDPFLALLCTANTVAAKLRAGTAVREQSKPSARGSEPEHDQRAIAVATSEHDGPASPETINAWELMADLEEEEEEGEEEEQERRRHLKEVADSSGLPKNHGGEPTDDGKGGASVVAGDGLPRTRSFHTVEDFDAMVAENCPLLLRQSEWSEHVQPQDGSKAQQGNKQQPLPGEGEEEQQTNDGNADAAPDRLHGPEGSDINVKPEPPGVDQTTWSRSSSRNGSARAAQGDAAGNISVAEQKGLRRRAMAKELKTLTVPSFEFSSVGSLREWLGGGGQVFSPGSYVTPKFGNFDLPAGAAPRSGGDSGHHEALFDPQLVAEMEEDMGRLTMEEEHILREIVESLHEEHAGGGQVDRHTT